MKALCELVVRGVVPRQWMWSAADGAGVGEEVRDDIVGPFDVLGGQAVWGIVEEGAELASNKLDGGVGDGVGGHLARLEQPANGGRVVANGKDALGAVGRVKADEPDADDHAQELQ
jgi:hypothetical protein